MSNMVQFNLLPDVKLEYIKTRNRKRLIVFISLIAGSVALAVFILLFLFARVNQPLHLKALNDDIAKSTKKIQETKDLDKILTIQNQLNSLPNLHNDKTISSRLADYLTKVTPNQASIYEVAADFENNTITLKGNADSLTTVNKFTDSLKFTDYRVNGEGAASGKAFKNVVLQNFGIADNATNGAVSYELKFEFEPVIFKQVKGVEEGKEKEPVTLTVPKITSTRSETEKPENLFTNQPQPQQPQNEGGQ